MNAENKCVDSKEFEFYSENEVNTEQPSQNISTDESKVDVAQKQDSIEYEPPIGTDRPRRKNAGAGVKRLEPNFNNKDYTKTHGKQFFEQSISDKKSMMDFTIGAVFN